MTYVATNPAYAPPQHTAPSHRSVGESVVACLLVFAQLWLFLGSFMVAGFEAMGSDACSYRACGDPAWMTGAMCLAIVGGGALVLGSAVVTLRRIVGNRAAWFVPLIGCLAQVALVVASVAMAVQAGPLTH